MRSNNNIGRIIRWNSFPLDIICSKISMSYYVISYNDRNDFYYGSLYVNAVVNGKIE